MIDHDKAQISKLWSIVVYHDLSWFIVWYISVTINLLYMDALFCTNLLVAKYLTINKHKF